MMDSITWKIGGEAGFGIMAAGTMLARTFARAGYHVLVTNDYPSLIRGGHNLVTVRIGTSTFEAMTRDVHALVALNAETVELHKHELNDGAVVIFDPRDREWQAGDFSKKVELVSLPMRELAAGFHADPVMRNTVSLGATVALVDAPFKFLASVIRNQFKKKGEEVINLNLQIAQSGYDHVKEHYREYTKFHLGQGTVKDAQLVLNGSEAVGVGAVRAGLKFAAIYPMTPINALITFLADHAKALNLVYRQPEDEIAGINMAIGASLTGVRSMVATSGGGFALMVEGLSWAGMIEAPVVIDLGMRVGPSTGMPTWSEQGELRFVIQAGHGEFARIVLAPGDAAEAYSLTIDAFNLAERYQVPVFLLTDKYLNESQWCVTAANLSGEVVLDRGKLILTDTGQSLAETQSFPRYTLDMPDGVSARPALGVRGGQYVADSYEHDEMGHVTEDPVKRTAMTAKRLKKLAAITKEAPAPIVYGDPQAGITLVAWGSTKGPILEAMKLLNKQGQKVRLIHFTWVYPFPTEAVNQLLSSSSRIIDIEHNATAQLASLVREHTGIEITEKILKFDGRPFYPEEIVEQIA